MKDFKTREKQDQKSCNENICKKARTWLEDNKLMVIETDKSRTTCITEEEKVSTMIQTKLIRIDVTVKKNNNIVNVRSKVNKELIELKESGLIIEKLCKDSNPYTPKTPFARH